jgi:hypothetical protein
VFLTNQKEVYYEDFTNLLIRSVISLINEFHIPVALSPAKIALDRQFELAPRSDRFRNIVDGRGEIKIGYDSKGPVEFVLSTEFSGCKFYLLVIEVKRPGEYVSDRALNQLYLEGCSAASRNSASYTEIHLHDGEYLVDDLEAGSGVCFFCGLLIDSCECSNSDDKAKTAAELIGQHVPIVCDVDVYAILTDFNRWKIMKFVTPDDRYEEMQIFQSYSIEGVVGKGGINYDSLRQIYSAIFHCILGNLKQLESCAENL